MIEEEVKEEVKVEKKMSCRLYCSFLVNRDYYIQMDYKELVWNLFAPATSPTHSKITSGWGWLKLATPLTTPTTE